MSSMKSLLLAAAALTVVGAGAAEAALSLNAIQGGAPTGSVRDNLDALPLGSGGGVTATGITVSFNPSAAAVQGSVDGEYAAPFISGSNGVGFGNAPGQDTTTYVTSGSTGNGGNDSITFLLPANGGVGYLYFGLLWGSIDDYNTLEFFDGATPVGTVTGAQVTATPTGDQGAAGTRYVNITSTVKFDRVVATSSEFAFEIDNIAYNATIPVPAPAALGVFGVGLLGLAWAARRRG